MPEDPYFDGDPIKKAVPSRWWWWTGRLVLYPLLALSGCHMLLTGSPVPLRHVERLHDPIAVTAIGEEALVLADGRRVRLPFIRNLPQGDPAFARALEYGVEVGEGGEVYGLIDTPRECGNDPVWFYRQRANLSDLAGLLNPAGIDDSIVHPDEIRLLKEDDRRAPGRNGMPYYIMGQLARMRRVYEHHSGRLESEAHITHPDGPG